MLNDKNLRILLVDDDPAMLRLLTRWLAAHRYDVRTACDGKQALQVMETWPPHMILTDLEMPRIDGIELCQRVRNRCLGHYIYTIVLTVRSSSADIVQALEAGADDFLKKPVDRDELIARLRAGLRVLELENRLNLLSRLDPLTSLASQRTLLERMEQEFARSTRHCSPLTAVILDLDDFRKVNEKYGHVIGDEVLCKIGQLIYRNTRSNDLVARLSGKQFGVLLTDTQELDALIWAERIRRTIENHEHITDRDVIKLTASIGIAGRMSDTKTPDQLLDLAKQCLVTAKSLGQNRVVNYLSLRDFDADSLSEVYHAIDGLVAKDVMSHFFATLKAEDTAATAASYFLESRQHVCPIVDDEGRLMGIVGQKDLLSIMLYPDWQQRPLKQVMKTNVVSYDENSPAIKIYEFISRSAMRTVVIVSDGKPIGLFSRESLLQWFVNQQTEKLDPESTQSLQEHLHQIAGLLSQEAAQLVTAIQNEPDDLQARVITGASRMQQGLSDLLAYAREIPKVDSQTAENRSKLAN